MPPDTHDPVPSPLSLMDEAGRVYMTPNRVYRAVPPSAEAPVRALLASGLPDALATSGLMPSTQVSDRTLPGSKLVLEHPRLPFVTYPFEWSYRMVQAAAACVLEVNREANRHGYELTDCHGFNVVFDGPAPRYVDLGSLAPRPVGARGWSALETFVCSYEYPLRIWSHGGGFIARRLLAASDLMQHADYGLYRWPWLRLGGAARYNRWRHWWYRYRESASMTRERIEARLPLGLRRLGVMALQSGRLPGQSLNLDRMRAKIVGRPRRGVPGSWSEYQKEGAEFVQTARFRRVRDIVAAAGLDSVIDLGGNQGHFCDYLLATGAVRRAICADADETAVDQAFARSQAAGSNLQTVVLDFVHPMVSPFGEPPAARLQCDGAVVLAVTHHLLLTQRVPIDRVLRAIAGYARRFVAIEFMPLGLWDGKQAPPVPAWYTLAWFREEFARVFELTLDEPLEPNRHLFCGKIRGR
ncbi:MAG: hypothetical protein KF897_16960 [Opitutaceae bacterium]|nr:hypothetical protein [Opitutaceae bacterium]